jgi:choline dehydrogenase-like flavoprotein
MNLFLKEYGYVSQRGSTSSRDTFAGIRHLHRRAGPTALAMAKRLIGSSKQVQVLSSGLAADRSRPSNPRQSIYKRTLGAFLQKVDPVFLDCSRLHMYGGTTNHFGFWSRPLDEADFKPCPGYRDAAWPITHDDLIPYYRDAHHFGHFGPFNY